MHLQKGKTVKTNNVYLVFSGCHFGPEAFPSQLPLSPAGIAVAHPEGHAALAHDGETQL